LTFSTVVSKETSAQLFFACSRSKHQLHCVRTRTWAARYGRGFVCFGDSL